MEGLLLVEHNSCVKGRAKVKKREEGKKGKRGTCRLVAIVLNYLSNDNQ